MSLRARLALALALLATASVIAVATTNYLQTSDRLHEDLDAQLQADARPLLPDSDPKGLLVAQLCFALATSEDNELSGYAVRVSAQLGNSLQCIDADGQVTGRTGEASLPVTAADQRQDVSDPVMATRQYRGESYRTITIPGFGDGTVRITRSLARTNDMLASIRERSVLIGLGVMALAALGGWFIASRTARPIVRLTVAAEEVATTGRLDHPVSATGRGEVGRLTRAFTSMLHALDQSSAQQQRLVQDASHELRTPLTSLRTNLDTLRRHTELDPEVRDRVLADLDSELQELGALANELVQLTVDTRSAEPEAPVQLDRLARSAADRAIRRSGRTITVSATPTTVIARPAALSRAVGNLLDNATKFSPDGTTIEVNVSSGCLEVRDHGHGIDLHDLPYVFDRFYRAVDARKLPGSGLGLSIARAVIDSSGGRIYAENDPGGGAKFTLVLPTANGTPDQELLNAP
jgi:two-component system sensor histidine kinase MprB